MEVEEEVGAEAEAEVGEEAEETEGGEEAALLEAATVAVEVVHPEVVPLVVVLVGVAGVTLVSGRRTSEQFTLLSSRRKRTR